LDRYEVTKRPPVEPPPEEGFYRNWNYEYAAFEGGELTLYPDDEANKGYKLTDKKLLKGTAKAITQNLVDLEDVDGTAADAIIQLAIFNEVRYC
jgi:hypothetical protein